MRVYHDATVPRDALAALVRLGAELADVNKATGDAAVLANGRLWRFLVASDASVDRYVVRDADSRVSAREKAAVDAWARSGLAFHVMRDHPSHATYADAGLAVQVAAPARKSARSLAAAPNPRMRRVVPPAAAAPRCASSDGCASPAAAVPRIPRARSRVPR